jgi:DNA-directed RNA polymerase specialized sigma24 family protein
MSSTQPERIDVNDSLIQRILANDAATLEQLYIENYPKTEQYVLRNSGDADDAKDVFQEAFTAACAIKQPWQDLFSRCQKINGWIS